MGSYEAAVERAAKAAEKALALAPDLAEAYETRGLIRATFRFDWAGARGRHGVPRVVR